MVRIFISYSHDSEVHRERVRRLSDQLRDHNIDCRIDQYIEHDPPRSWPKWMENEIDKADFILVVCTKKYYQSYRGQAPKGKRKGSTWEGAIVRQELYDSQEDKSWIVPIFVDRVNENNIPNALRGANYYSPLTEDGYKSLYRHIKKIPKVGIPDLGEELALETAPESEPIIKTPNTKKLTVNLPHRNPIFTGRDDVIEKIHQAFQTQNSLAITQAIHGLGGVGKSATAVEYAHRYRSHYEMVFWVKAEKSDEYYPDFAAIGKAAGVASCDKANEETFNIVKDWLSQRDGWLMVLDNIEDVTDINKFLPSPCNGRVLFTTRRRTPGIDLTCMDEEEGSLLLLRRSELIEKADETQHELAREISRELGGLPLALDQAGAYIFAVPCSLDDYLELFHANKIDLNDRGELGKESHPNSVAVTFEICFQKVKQENPAAAQLLQLCAFLAPDDIPHEIFTEAADHLPDDLKQAASDRKKWFDCIKSATSYSLIDNNPTNKTLTIHRLLQTVLHERMDEGKRKDYAECCVNALNAVYPYIEFENWPQCERLTPHTQALSVWIDECKIESETSGRLCNQTAFYLYNLARYAEAEPLYKQAIAIWEKNLGPDHPNFASALNNLALLYHSQGNYTKAEPLFKRAFSIDEKTLGPDHPGLAIDLNNLAELYRNQGNYAEAEPRLKRAIDIDEKALRPDHPHLATHLNNLAVLYASQGNYTEAEPLFKRAIAIDEKALRSDHPHIATDLNNLAILYQNQGNYADAERQFKRAIAIDEKAFGHDHPNLARDLNNLAWLYQNQGKFAKAEPLYERALEIIEQTLPNDHPNITTVYENYAFLLDKTGQDEKATEYEAKAQTIRERRGGIDCFASLAMTITYLSVIANAVKQSGF